MTKTKTIRTIQFFLQSISGGHVIASMAIYAYISDYTTSETRSPNLAIIDGIEFLLRYAGTALGGILMDSYGPPIPYYIVCSVYALAFVYVIVVIRDRRKHKSLKGCRLPDVISIRRIVENWKTVAKKREGPNRRMIILILICNLVSAVCVIGEFPIVYDVVSTRKVLTPEICIPTLQHNNRPL